ERASACARRGSYALLDAEDQVAVAELVPVVAVLKGRVVAVREQFVPGGRGADVDVPRGGLVQAGEQGVDRPQAALGRYDQIRPTLADSDRAVGPGDRLDGADDRRSRGDTPRAPPTDGVHEPGSVLGHAVTLGVAALGGCLW